MKAILWLLSGTMFSITIIAGVANFFAQVNDPLWLRGATLLVYLSLVILGIIDMTRNKIYNKAFWIISIIILTPISGLIYMVQRNRLIRLGERFGS